MRLRRAAGRLGRQRSRPFPLSPSPAFKLNQAAALATVSAVALAAPRPDMVVGAAISAPAMVVLQPRPFWYRVAGEFTRDGKPVNAPLRMMRLDRTLTITAYQVTAADYQRCVLDEACPPAANASDRPAVKISWHDASAYAAWLSQRLGATYRLPTDEEWAFAAGSRFRDDGYAESAAEPAERWLRQYERSQPCAALAPARQAVGFGMLNDQKLDRRPLVGQLPLGRLPFERSDRLRQCAQRQQTKRDRAPHQDEPRTCVIGLT